MKRLSKAALVLTFILSTVSTASRVSQLVSFSLNPVQQLSFAKVLKINIKGGHVVLSNFHNVGILEVSCETERNKSSSKHSSLALPSHRHHHPLYLLKDRRQSL